MTRMLNMLLNEKDLALTQLFNTHAMEKALMTQTLVKQKLQSLQKMTVMATDMRKLKWRWHSKRYWDFYATRERISKEMGVLDLS